MDANREEGADIGSASGGSLPWSTLFLGIFALAFGTLLFEISLIRVFSFTIWHHFGYVVISTALLGFGASGTILAIRPTAGRTDLGSTLSRCALASGLTMVGALVLFAWIPLNPMALFDEPQQALVLLLYQVLAATPFFFSGLAVSLALRTGSARVDRLYFWDLMGGGLGCFGAVALMNWLTPPGVCVVAGAALAISAAIFATRVGPRRVAFVVAVALVLLAPAAHRLPFTPAKSKELSIQINRLGAKPVTSEWSALFRTDLLKLDSRPDYQDWGATPKAPKGLEQPVYYLTHDATAGAGFFDLRDGLHLDFVPYHIFQFAYLIAPKRPRVLVIGVGGGRDMVVAGHFDASHITGIDLDPVAIRFLKEDLNDLSAGFFNEPHVELVAAEGRHFVQTSDERYDVIQLTGVDTLSAVNSGAYVLSENFLYTVEAMHAYLDHLSEAGVLSFAMANIDPSAPRAAGRLVSVARRALLERGIPPESHIAVIDSGSLYASVLVKKTPFSATQSAELERIAAQLEMPALLIPGGRSHPVFKQIVSANGAARDRFLDGLRFRIDATHDDSPFFLSFFRWGDLFEPGRLTPSHSSALGQIVLGALLISLTALGGVFILLPLFVFGSRHVGGGIGHGVGVMLFFLAIGLGFMLFEISLIQRFVFFLGYPTYSLSVTLFSLLISLGCGSYCSRFWVSRHRQVLVLSVIAIALLALFYAQGMPQLQAWLFDAPLWVRVVVTAALLAPLGLVMGTFFPLGIRVASAIDQDWVPWAWGINGCASVTAGVLAVVLAMSFGFSFVWMVSVVTYVVGVAALLILTRDVSIELDE